MISMADEELLEKMISKETKEQLQQEYDIVQTLLEYDRINDSVFVDFLNIVETIVLRECARRYLETPVCEVRKFSIV